MATRSRMESPLRERDTSAPPGITAGAALASHAAAEPGRSSGSGPDDERAAQPVTSPPLRLRPLTGWEEEYLEQHQYDVNTARLCNEVLARCLVEPGTDHTAALARVRGLLVAERDRALIDLRRISLGPQVSAQVDCPGCGQPSNVRFSLDALAVDVPAVQHVVGADVPGAGPAQLRLPTAGDQEDLLDAAPDGEAAGLSWMLGRCLLLPGDGPDVREAGLDVVRGLPIQVRRQLQSTIEDALPQLDLEMTLECPHCGTPTATPFDVQSFFFRIEPPRKGAPARRPSASARLPLERNRYPQALPAPAAGISAASGTGRRRRASARPEQRRLGLIQSRQAS
jgi:endogenous inhibitor of DNA gyrase (YacG/DUF329 family)